MLDFSLIYEINNMDKKDDWKELEEWEQNRREEEKEKYGINIQDIKPTNIKWIDRLVKGLRAIGISYVIFATIVFSLAFIAVGLYLYAKYSNIKSQIDIDLEDTIESMYNIKIKIVSQDTDNRGNGKYTIKTKNSDIDITFNAVKDHGNLKEDYLAHFQKYYFDKWESETKENFIVKEEINDTILIFETYIEINNYDEIIGAVESINEFYEFCNKKKDFASWNIFIKYGKIILDPYTSSSTTEEDAIKNAQDQFKIKSEIIQE